jgi:tetratricopeptide (TPR) repeat protein
LILATAISVVVLIGVVVALLISEETMNAFFRGYERRLFNHTERLMTQFRILVYYLYQIAYPNPASLNLSHDFAVSTSLFSPWTTLPACVLIFGILWSSWYFLPRFPLLAFGGLFFLLHHSIESSLLPLEMVFEHRNYIPSMFLFAGPAAGLFRLISHYRERNPSLHRLIAVGSALLLCFVGLGTYNRNSDWRTERSLWEDALQKAPGSGRAYHNLAWGYYDRIRDADTSMALYQQAIDKQIYRKGTAATSYLNIGNIYYHQGDYRAAIAQYLKSLRLNPNKISTHIRMIQSYMALSEWHQAEAAIESAISLGKHREIIYRLKARWLLTQNQPATALEWFRKANRLGGAEIWQDLAGIGQSLRLLGHYERGDYFLRCAQKIAPQELFLLLSRLDLYLDAGQWEGATALADQFVRSVPAGKVGTVWEQLRSDPSHYSLQYQRLRPLVEAALHRALRQFENSQDLMASKRQ